MKRSDILIPIVIVTWNSEKDITECIKSILKQTHKFFRIIVVDNNSQDKTVEISKSFSEKDDRIDVLPQKKNQFLTKGNNIGIRYAIQKYSPEFIMTLNPDTVMDPDLIDILLDGIMAKQEIGATGPKIRFLNNRDFGLINSAGLSFDGFMQAYDIGFRQKDDGSYDTQKEVFGVSGACVLYRVKMLLDIGFFWEKIKLYMDEVELFIRAQKKHWKVLYLPKAILWHKYMQSTNKFKNRRIQKIKNFCWLLIAFRHYRLKSKIAMLIFYIKNYFK